MESTPYITSTEAVLTDTPLAPETQLLINSAAASIAANMLDQLSQAALISHQYTGNTALMLGRKSVDVYDHVIRSAFHTGLQHTIAGLGGIKTPTIVVDIAGFFGASGPSQLENLC